MMAAFLGTVSLFLVLALIGIAVESAQKKQNRSSLPSSPELATAGRSTRHI